MKSSPTALLLLAWRLWSVGTLTIPLLVTNSLAAPVHVWEKVEITLQASNAFANPYTDAQVWVELIGPGFSRRCYGFWDGGNTFRVRVLANRPGVWHWRSGCRPEDPGLTGRNGEFQAVPWTEAEKQANICRRGNIRATANGHAFEHADGTPFFLMGDTWWATPTFRFPWRDGIALGPPAPEASFQDYVRFRQQQEYNSIALIAALPNWANDGHPATLRMADGTFLRSAWREAGTDRAKNMTNELGHRAFLFPGKVPGFENVFPDVERLDPEYFQTLDRKMDYLNEQGFIPFVEVARRDIGQAWKKYYPWPESYTRFIQYVWSRYQAHVALFSPIHFDTPSQSIPPEDWNRAANAVLERFGPPPFGTLVGNNANPSSLRNWGHIDKAPWLGFHQIGNRRTHDCYAYLKEIFQARPPLPGINGEPYYDGMEDAEPGSEVAALYCRSAMYGSVLSGGLGGHIYGAGGWQGGLWSGEVEPASKYPIWEVIRWASADQMRHLKRFILSEGRRYQELEPADEAIAPNRSGKTNGLTGWAYAARTTGRDLFLLYFERDCPRAVLSGARANTQYQAQWFNPRTGEWLGPGLSMRADVDGKLALPPFPGSPERADPDWALKLMSERIDGVYFRLKLLQPAGATWFAKIGGHIHNEPWVLPEVVWPARSDREPARRLMSGEFTPWFDLRAHAGKSLHGRQNRAGGVAEFPNITSEFVCDVTNRQRQVVIELATAPEETAVVKRFEESFTGQKTSFLVSPTLRADADSLETASQMSARRLTWAREASGGKRVSSTNLWIQTQFWAPQRPELNLQEAEVLWLLGFNLVNNFEENEAKFPFLKPGGHHWVEFGPELTREDIERQIEKPAKRGKAASRPTLYGFSDEIACRPGIGTNAAALAHFRTWLKERGLVPAELGVESLDEVVPIESPNALRERQSSHKPAANRTFYWTTRFRQESATRRLKWLTESFHQHGPSNVLTTTLVADHPYFGGSGLGMGMDRENTTWGGYPLSLDWFGLGRERVVDVMGIEDWLGLNFMYGPGSTWEGFQLMGFQAAIFRSASGGELPIIAWITPSDETNLRLKSASALCQGTKHFYYWTYGPTATSTENYWSDLRSAYDGIVAITRQLAQAEHIISLGRPRASRVAVLYAVASDLWQPFGYLSMAERRLTYFSLIHDQYLVDFITEEDVASGRLQNYDALYVTDPCLSSATCAQIRRWVNEGGWLYGSTAAASRNEFDEEHAGLADVFGIAPKLTVSVQKGRFDVRGGLNDLPWLDQVQFEPGSGHEGFGALGLKARVSPTTGTITARFSDGAPAVLSHTFGRGRAIYVATCPAVSYAKDARFVTAELKEKWPARQRRFINSVARGSGATPIVELSHSVVEAGLFETPKGVALVLANFTYEKIPKLEISIPLRATPLRVRSCEKGNLEFVPSSSSGWAARAGHPKTIRCFVELGLNDIILFELP